MRIEELNRIMEDETFDAFSGQGRKLVKERQQLHRGVNLKSSIIRRNIHPKSLNREFSNASEETKDKLFRSSDVDVSSLASSIDEYDKRLANVEKEIEDIAINVIQKLVNMLYREKNSWQSKVKKHK